MTAGVVIEKGCIETEGKRKTKQQSVSWRIWSRTWEQMRETSKTEARERPKHSLEGARREDESQEGQGGLKFGWPSLSTVLSCVPIPLQFRQGIRGDRLYSKVVGLVHGRDENKQAEKKERERRGISCFSLGQAFE